MSHTAIGFYDKNNQFADALLRQTVFLKNISVYLSPKFLKSYILLCGINLQEINFQNENGPSEMTAENNTEFFIISDVKLFERKHSHTIFIYESTAFIELEL